MKVVKLTSKERAEFLRIKNADKEAFESLQVAKARLEKLENEKDDFTKKLSDKYQGSYVRFTDDGEYAVLQREYGND